MGPNKKEYDSTMTGLALLGAEFPAVLSLPDLPQLYGSEQPDFVEVSSSNRVRTWFSTRSATASNAGSSGYAIQGQASVSDVVDAFYEQVATEESGRYWWWAQLRSTRSG